MKDLEIKDLLKESLNQPSDNFTDELMKEIELTTQLNARRRKLAIEVSSISMLLFILSLFVNFSSFTLFNTTIEINNEIFPILVSIIILALAVYISSAQQKLHNFFH